MNLFAAAGKDRFPALRYEDDALNGNLYLLLKRRTVRTSLIVGTVTKETDGTNDCKTTPAERSLTAENRAIREDDKVRRERWPIS